MFPLPYGGLSPFDRDEKRKNEFGSPTPLLSIRRVCLAVHLYVLTIFANTILFSKVQVLWRGCPTVNARSGPLLSCRWECGAGARHWKPCSHFARQGRKSETPPFQYPPALFQYLWQLRGFAALSRPWQTMYAAVFAPKREKCAQVGARRSHPADSHMHNRRPPELSRVLCQPPLLYVLP